MAENEGKDNDEGSSGNDGHGGDSESRFSFLSRNESESGSGNGGSSGDSNGSGSGESGNGSSDSDSRSEQSEESSGGVDSGSETRFGEDSGAASGSGGDGRGGARGGERQHLRYTRKCQRCVAAGAACGRQTETPSDSAETREARTRRYAQTAAPQSVDFGEIFPGLNEGKPVKVDSLLALAYATLFDLIKIMRKEDHWELTKEEAGKLGKVSVACMNTMPETKAKLVKKFEKQLPWISLVGFGMVITYPRVMASVELEKQKKVNRFPMSPPIPFSGKDTPADTLRSVPLGSERESTQPASNGNGEAPKSSFPPGHNANFPPLDFEIPS
jgi:hypothetical protein